MQRLTDPTCEIHIATVGEEITGVLILFFRWRGRGIGTRMMEFAEQKIFRLSPNVFLCVSSFNSKSQKFYERLGYQRVGELADFVVEGCSEFLMRKTRRPLLNFKPEA